MRALTIFISNRRIIMNTSCKLSFYKPLLSIALDLTEKEIGGLDKIQQEIVTDTFTKLISGEISPDRCRRDVSSICGAFNTAERIISILKVTDEPLPAPTNPSIEKVHTWSEQEDNRLLAGISRYGLSDWASISKFVGAGRSRSQCSQRWNRSLNPVICKEKWSRTEDDLLFKAVAQFGCHAWSKIACAVKTRTDVQCRYRYQLLTRKKPIAPECKLEGKENVTNFNIVTNLSVVTTENPQNDNKCELWEGLFHDFEIDDQCMAELYSLF